MVEHNLDWNKDNSKIQFASGLQNLIHGMVNSLNGFIFFYFIFVT